MNATYFCDMINAFDHWETIDTEMEWLDDYDLTPNVIKIDVEGFEMDVLKGAFQTLRKTKLIQKGKYIRMFFITIPCLSLPLF